jgi:hypothetical protein
MPTYRVEHPGSQFPYTDRFVLDTDNAAVADRVGTEMPGSVMTEDTVQSPPEQKAADRHFIVSPSLGNPSEKYTEGETDELLDKTQMTEGEKEAAARWLRDARPGTVRRFSAGTITCREGSVLDKSLIVQKLPGVSRLVCLDVGGVLANKDTSEDYAHLEPLEGCKEFLEALREHRVGTVINSAHPVDEVTQWLQKYQLYDLISGGTADPMGGQPYPKVISEKPRAEKYIDDRMVRYKGDYDEALDAILDFEPWWFKGKYEIDSVALDFDATLNTYGMAGTDDEFGDAVPPPQKGAQEFVAKLYSKVGRVVIFSCRPPQQIEAWLTKWKFDRHIDAIEDHKPKVKVYLDDRGMRFKGKYDKILDKLRLLEPETKATAGGVLGVNVPPGNSTATPRIYFEPQDKEAKEVTCEDCGGKGVAPDGGSNCPTCLGSGKVQVADDKTKAPVQAYPTLPPAEEFGERAPQTAKPPLYANGFATPSGDNVVTKPSGTKVDDVYQALLREGHDEGSAARIAQAQTGQALATGKPPEKSGEVAPNAEELLGDRFGNAPWNLAAAGDLADDMRPQVRAAGTAEGVQPSDLSHAESGTGLDEAPVQAQSISKVGGDGWPVLFTTPDQTVAGVVEGTDRDTAKVRVTSVDRMGRFAVGDLVMVPGTPDMRAEEKVGDGPEGPGPALMRFSDDPTITRDIKVAYSEGYRAAESGERPEDNPYIVGEPYKASGWTAGWQDGNSGSAPQVKDKDGEIYPEQPPPEPDSVDYFPGTAPDDHPWPAAWIGGWKGKAGGRVEPDAKQRQIAHQMSTRKLLESRRSNGARLDAMTYAEWSDEAGTYALAWRTAVDDELSRRGVPSSAVPEQFKTSPFSTERREDGWWTLGPVGTWNEHGPFDSFEQADSAADRLMNKASWEDKWDEHEDYDKYERWLTNMLRERPRSLQELRTKFSEPKLMEVILSRMLRMGMAHDIDDLKKPGGTLYALKSLSKANTDDYPSGENYDWRMGKALSPDEVQRAEKVDFVHLPPSVKGTNCGNCRWVKDGFCTEPRVQFAVTDRDCCALWDAEGVKRDWEKDKGGGGAIFPNDPSGKPATIGASGIEHVGGVA